jgi:trans-aconitate 2-methyltransferase
LEDVIEEVRSRPRWAAAFAGFRKPFVHFLPDQYRALADEAGFRVVGIEVEDQDWDFKTRAGFTGFARATFVEWTRRLPEDQWDAFIAESIDSYRAAVDEVSKNEYIFKFYQMQVELERADG